MPVWLERYEPGGEHREMRWESCGWGRTFSGIAWKVSALGQFGCGVGKGLEEVGASGG